MQFTTKNNPVLTKRCPLPANLTAFTSSTIRSRPSFWWADDTDKHVSYRFYRLV